MENQIEIYQGSDGQTQIEVKFEAENCMAISSSNGHFIQPKQTKYKFAHQ